MATPLAIAWAAASGASLVLLGLLVVGLRPKASAAWLFAAFCLAWGAEIVAGNLLRATGWGVLSRLSQALFLPATLFLVGFATSYPHRSREPAARLALGAAAATSTGAAALFLAAPGLLLEGIAGSPGSFAPDLGPAAPWLVHGPFFAALDFAAAWFYMAYARSRGVARPQARLLLAGTLLFVSYFNAWNLRVLATFTAYAQGLGAVNALFLGLLFGGGLLLVAGIALRLALERPPHGPDVFLVACAVAPAAVAGAELGLAFLGLGVETLGLWRLGMVGFLAYAVARYQLFDLDLRLQGVSGRVLPAAAALLAGAVTFTLLEAAPPPLPLAGAAAAALPAGFVAWRAREPAVRLLLPRGAHDEAYLRHRRLEVYQATLERLLAESSLRAEDETFLRALRGSLGIGERDHEALERAARRALLAARAAGPWAPAAPGGLVLGRYRVERLLGEGGHGRAYLAFDEREGREVAIKAVDTGALGGRAAKLLLREARILLAVRHLHVATVHEVAERAEGVVMVMEYAEGGSLHGLLRRRRLGLEESVRILDEVLAGLEAAHAKGIVHRDLKPENVLLARDGSVKLADFGVAREGLAESTLLPPGAAGTLAYMSPEQVRGEAVDARSDLYAAAVLFHQCLTGSFYLRLAGLDDFQVRRAIVQEAPRFPPEVPAWAREVLRRGLAKDPARRFASAAEMRRALPHAPLAAAR